MSSNDTQNTRRIRAVHMPAAVKYASIALGAVLCIAIGMWIYHIYAVERPQQQYAAKIESVKTMMRHNALEIVDEAIFADTIAGICEVYSVKARITVQYNLEQMRYAWLADTLVVELPNELISAHELDRRLIDEYFADQKLHINSPAITGEQMRIVESHIRQFVIHNMVNAEHIRRARQNELRNIARLLQTIHPNVRVVINIDKPYAEADLTALPIIPDA